jgi:hypothetical protein
MFLSMPIVLPSWDGTVHLNINNIRRLSEMPGFAIKICTAGVLMQLLVFASLKCMLAKIFVKLAF